MHRGDAQRPQLVRQRGPEAHDALRLQRRPLEARYAVNEQTPPTAPSDGVEQPVSELIQDVLTRGMPQHRHITPLLCPGELEAHRLSREPQCFRGLVAAE